MQILNLYAGIGGNRKLWSDEHSITAVEFNPKIADIYQKLYPSDKVIVADAHQFLLENYKNFDFIWSSPPCISHSILNYQLNARGYIRYPDLKLYEEIIFLQTFFNGKYCVENVKSYYKPLIIPQVSGRHFFWSNFKIPKMKSEISIKKMSGKSELKKIEYAKLGFDLSNFDLKSLNKGQLLRNCCDPKIAQAILNQVVASIEQQKIKQLDIFL